MMIFHVLLEEAEDGWIVAECPALAGCVSQGRDEEEALANIQEAISAWLWAEDQKAITNLPKNLSRPPMMVMVGFMGRLNNISGKEAVAAFLKADWFIMGQVGSHLVMTKPNERANLSIPQHKELSVGTLRVLIRNSGLTVEQFLDLL